MIAIITKIEYDNKNKCLKHTDVGYTEIQDVTDSINIEYDQTLGEFIAKNLTKLSKGDVDIASFFVDMPFVHEARTLVDSVDGTELQEIKNTNEL